MCNRGIKIIRKRIPEFINFSLNWLNHFLNIHFLRETLSYKHSLAYIHTYGLPSLSDVPFRVKLIEWVTELISYVYSFRITDYDDNDDGGNDSFDSITYSGHEHVLCATSSLFCLLMSHEFFFVLCLFPYEIPISTFTINVIGTCRLSRDQIIGQ